MKKIKLSKISLLVKNNYAINKSVPLILFAVLFTLSCIVGVMPVSNAESNYTYGNFDMHHNEYYIKEMTNVYESLTGFDGGFSLLYLICGFLFAIVSVLSLNSFMRNKSGSDFYHSMSVNRGEIYLANFFTAFVNSAAAVCISQSVALIMMNFFAGYKPMSLFELFAVQLPVILTLLLYIAIFIAIAMIATTVTGTNFAAILGYIAIIFYIPATICAVSVAGDCLYNSSLMDYLEHFPHIYAYSSPFIRYAFGASDGIPFTALTYVLTILALAGLVILGMWIYSKKKNENSEKPIVFKKSIRPIQYLITFDAILFGATLFELFTFSVAWSIIGGLLALFFSFIAFNAFQSKSFNNVFEGAKHMVYILIVTVVAGVIFVFDAFGIYSEPVPVTEDMEFAYVNISLRTEEKEDWISLNFTPTGEETYETVKLDDEAKKLISDIWDEVNKASYSYESQGNAIELSKSFVSGFYDTVSVTIGIDCAGDFARYHAHCYSDSEELITLVEKLLEYPQKAHEVYYYGQEGSKY